MSKLIDLTGRRFGRLVVIERAGTDGAYPTWLCKCDCGATFVTRGCHLRRGDTQSCGCLHLDLLPQAHATHGKSKSRLYFVWCSMKRRCYNQNTKAYKNYGGRGITVCEEWLNDFEAFRAWAFSNGYDETAPQWDCTIDRIDVDKGYSPENCRWVDMKTQQNNRRNNRKPKK